MPPDYDDGVSLPRGGLNSSLPSPRKISLVVHQHFKKEANTNNQRRISQMVMQFGQFLDHDISITPEQDRHCCEAEVLFEDLQEEEEMRFCFNIDVEEDDPFYSNRITCLPFTRSDGICDGNTREQFNILTAFIDGSQIYGSDEETALSLRTLEKGKMKTHKLGPTLPTRGQTGLHNNGQSPGDMVAGNTVF